MTAAPIAKKVRSERVHHGDVFVDDYEWLRDKTDPEVIAYLDGQNAHTEAQTADLADLRTAIFGEIKARTQETDMGLPTRSEGYWYFARTTEGQSYAKYCRCPIRGDDDWTPPEVSVDAALPSEEVFFDANREAAGTEFFSMGALSVSHDGTRLAYSVDTEGDERYTLRFRDLGTGIDLPGEVRDTAGGATWSKDGRFVFYLTVDDAWRPDTVWRHEVGAGADDVKVFHEPDEHFWVGVGSTPSEEYLLIGADSKLTSEMFVLSADDPTGEFVSVAGRTPGTEYGVDHARIDGDDYFLIVHNGEVDGAKAVNYAVDIAPVDDIGARRPFIPHDPSRRIEDVDSFRDYLVLSYRSDALPKLAVADLRAVRGVPTIDDFVEVRFDQDLCSAGLGSNPEWGTPRLRIVYTSFVDPVEALDLDVATGQRTLLRRQTVLGDYDPSEYVATRDWATAQDGTRIPVSLVRRRDLADGPAPVLLVGYGAYETPIDPGFAVSRLSLLDRGVVMAYAHIRGGGELGRPWYEGGRLMHKRNTFTDYIDVARHLIDTGRTSPQQLIADGGSAGGLLMGAVANMAPELFRGVLAAVPFVDALTSMLDPTLPLTVTEWDEWGDPYHDPNVYDYMKSYSPYENVAPRDYPAILALASLNDTRVLFTEAAKWVARLQESTTSGRPVLLKTEMSAGHGGVSGRYKQWEETAYELAWILRESGAVTV
ncbi:S9 family peptidase [Gordonia sp. HY002]|uniref:S9 family peptidase n=2 Tax=Gordonia zhenghanii TaxID=2911516 RepID=UPI001F2878BC|nr:S9 family peptidase [Gordonia zhenghanii]MCF8569001.1 S9 family peptidase [Gordonia zhenghanii]